MINLEVAQECALVFHSNQAGPSPILQAEVLWYERHCKEEMAAGSSPLGS